MEVFVGQRFTNQATTYTTFYASYACHLNSISFSLTLISMLLFRFHKTKLILFDFFNTKKHHDIPYHPCFFLRTIYILLHFYGTKNSENFSCQVDPETFRRYVFWRNKNLGGRGSP